MVAPLAKFTSEEQSAVIQFLWLEGVSGAEIHRMFLTQYGNRHYRKEACTSGLKSLKVAGQAWTTQKKQNVH